MNGSNDTTSNETGIHYATSLYVNICNSEYGPLGIWLAAVAALIVVVAGLVWVIFRHVNNAEQPEETGYQIGQTIFVANFPTPLVNGKGTGLSTRMYNVHQHSKLTDHSTANREPRKPLL